MSTDAGCTYVGKVLELRYRLPKTWERVLALEVPVWKAFRVCESTMNLSYEAARYIDQMLAPVLHSCTFAQIERTVAQAVDLYDPDEAERRAAKAADDRSFDIHLGTRGPTTDGTIAISGSVSLEDALDLEQAVKDGAKNPRRPRLRREPRRPPLDGRRRDGPQPTRPQPRNRRRRRRRVRARHRVAAPVVGVG